MDMYEKIKSCCNDGNHKKLEHILSTDRTLCVAGLADAFLAMLSVSAKSDITAENYNAIYNIIKSDSRYNHATFWFSIMLKLHIIDFSKDRHGSLFIFIRTGQFVIDDLDEVWQMVYENRFPGFSVDALVWLYTLFVYYDVDMKMPLYDRVREQIMGTHKEWLEKQRPEIQILFI